MLRELRIKNLAVVEDAVIEFDKGLNVLTGSTGAGNSIILAAVELLSGSRASKSLIRYGAEHLTVEGIFSVPRGALTAEKLVRDGSDKQLSIKRDLRADGKSLIWVDGRITTKASSRRTAGSLFERNGQHGQQELLDPSNHIVYLDARGDYRDLLERCMDMIASRAAISERLRKLEAEAERNSKQEDFIRYQLGELEALKLERDLDRRLEKRIKRLENLHRYMSGLQESSTLLSEGSGSVLDKLAKAEKLLESLSSLDESWEKAASEVNSIRISIQEIVRDIERAAGQMQDEPEDLEILQERLAAIQRASRKYGLDCNGLMERKQKLNQILLSLTEGSDDIVETKREMAALEKELFPLLEELSRHREANARDLDREVTEELKRLGMKGALFHTCVERQGSSDVQGGLDGANLFPNGWDRVEFMIRTNIGEEIHPLSEVASGGELSRITLVIKKLQVEEKGIPTLIFDEIDTGLGADLGAVVAERLKELSKRYQIICITHIPQVAARAGQHILIEKKVRGARTITTASVLAGRERLDEIARMLGGKGRLREELAAELLEGSKSARSSAG